MPSKEQLVPFSYDFGLSRLGIEPVTSRSLERTLYQLSFRGHRTFVTFHSLTTLSETLYFKTILLQQVHTLLLDLLCLYCILLSFVDTCKPTIITVVTDLKRTTVELEENCALSLSTFPIWYLYRCWDVLNIYLNILVSTFRALLRKICNIHCTLITEPWKGNPSISYFLKYLERCLSNQTFLDKSPLHPALYHYIFSKLKL